MCNKSKYWLPATHISRVDKSNKRCKVLMLNYSLWNKSGCKLSQPTVKVNNRRNHEYCYWEKKSRTHVGDLFGPGRNNEVVHYSPTWNCECIRTFSCPRLCLHLLKPSPPACHLSVAGLFHITCTHV